MSAAARIKVRVAVRVPGRGLYTKPETAAMAWAYNVGFAMTQRHSAKIGMAAYHDEAWEARNGFDPAKVVDYGMLQLNTGETKLTMKAYRRALPIFRRIFAKEAT